MVVKEKGLVLRAVLIALVCGAGGLTASALQNPLDPPRSNPLDQPQPSNPLAQPAPNPLSQPSAGGARPACPQGWGDFANPLLGMAAHVPPGYWVRIKGGSMLSVEKIGSPQTAAVLIPFRPKPNSATKLTAAVLADQVGRFFTACDQTFRYQVQPNSTPDRAVTSFSSNLANQPAEGRYCTLLAANGSMAFVVGVMAPAGKLQQELPTLQRIAEGFGYTGPRCKWAAYNSPAGGFTLSIPQGWQVVSTDGRSPKANIDFYAVDPANPVSRAFQVTGFYVTPNLQAGPVYQVRGYQVAQFANHEQIAAATMGQLFPGIRIKQMNPNALVTQLGRAMVRDVARNLAALQAGQIDFVAYDCVAEAQIDGRPVSVVFCLGIRPLAINMGGSGMGIDLDVWARGWCAPPQRFIHDTPVLDRVQASFAHSPRFIARVVNGNEHAAKVIRETYDYMNRVDQQITRSRWDTQDAIAEMYYDLWTDNGGYVNHKTGRIEQYSQEKIVRNSSGQMVSKEEVELMGVPRDQATVLRDAYSEDYMRGVHGRIQFWP